MSEHTPSNLDVISYLKFNKQKFADLSDKNKNICINFKVVIREIFCLTQLFKSTIQKSNQLNYPSIQDLYNYLEKFNAVFKELFKFRIAEINRGGILEPYALLRHSIAHSHFVLVNNQIKPVDWEFLKDKKKTDKTLISQMKVNDIIDLDLNVIREEMTFVSMIFCQIITLYQLMQQD